MTHEVKSSWRQVVFYGYVFTLFVEVEPFVEALFNWVSKFTKSLVEFFFIWFELHFMVHGPPRGLVIKRKVFLVRPYTNMYKKLKIDSSVLKT